MIFIVVVIVLERQSVAKFYVVFGRCKCCVIIINAINQNNNNNVHNVEHDDVVSSMLSC